MNKILIKVENLNDSWHNVGIKSSEKYDDNFITFVKDYTHNTYEEGYKIRLRRWVYVGQADLEYLKSIGMKYDLSVTPKIRVKVK